MFIIEAIKYLAELAKDGKGSNRKVKWIEVGESYQNDFVSGTVTAVRVAGTQPVPGLVSLELDFDSGGTVMLSIDQPILIVWGDV